MDCLHWQQLRSGFGLWLCPTAGRSKAKRRGQKFGSSGEGAEDSYLKVIYLCGSPILPHMEVLFALLHTPGRHRDSCIRHIQMQGYYRKLPLVPVAVSHPHVTTAEVRRGRQ